MTPRRIRLIRTAGLRGLHQAIANLCGDERVDRVRGRAVLVPSRAAAAQLRTTLEDLAFAGDQPASRPTVLAWPELLTREDFYRRLHERLGAREPRLSGVEREVLLNAAAREAIEQGTRPPFRMRPGLIAEMLALYDTLLRQQRSIERFESLIVEDLEPRVEIDRGAERLLRQTRFLVTTFRAFDRRLAASGGLDEHGLRQRLLQPGIPRLFHHVVVTVGDRAADPSGGLYPADFDLLTRMPHVERVDVVATAGMLASGLGQRLRDIFPDLEEEDGPPVNGSPTLVVPEGEPRRPYYVSRDREEELRATARRVKRAGRDATARMGKVAVVFGRPLPYVYLARTVFGAAHIQYQVADALPLAAEPYAALVEQVAAAVATRFGRTSIVSLLRSPHLHAGGSPSPGSIAALDRALNEAGYLGDARRLDTLSQGWTGPLAIAAASALTLVAGLAPLAAAAPVSSHVETLLAFLRAHERARTGEDPTTLRHRRARAAVLVALEELQEAARRHDDPTVPFDEVAATIRRAIEARTFTPLHGSGGVQLVDARAARYGDFDAVHLVGLVDGEWPDPAGRDIFYPPFLLAQLGWPSDAARAAAARAEFDDLLRLARCETRVSSFSLEDDAIVEPSPLLEDLERANLPSGTARDVPMLVFEDEALTQRPVDHRPSGVAVEWLQLRVERTPASDPAFHGDTGVGALPVHGVTAVDRYLECPFKYFAATILRLPEDPPEVAGVAPRTRGIFIHEIFRAFFARWHAQGGRAITPASLEQARAVFREEADRHLQALPAAEAALERMRLLGSAATPGLGEIALAAEAVRPVPVRERLLEHPIEGAFTLAWPEGGARVVRLRGKVDRVDLLDDKTLRVIDYKTGRAPDTRRAIQLPIYAVCLQQHLEASRGESWGIAEASYLAFGERDAVKVVLDGEAGATQVLADAQARFLEAVERIERGEFPPQPAVPRLCATCAYAAVCRKDHVAIH